LKLLPLFPSLEKTQNKQILFEGASPSHSTVARPAPRSWGSWWILPGHSRTIPGKLPSCSVPEVKKGPGNDSKH
jgi:hypothetical protein